MNRNSSTNKTYTKLNSFNFAVAVDLPSTVPSTTPNPPYQFARVATATCLITWMYVMRFDENTYGPET